MEKNLMQPTLEKLVMAHRFLFFIAHNPVLSDKEYDKLMDRALEVAGCDSCIVALAPTDASVYDLDVIELAESLVRRKMYETHTRTGV